MLYVTFAQYPQESGLIWKALFDWAPHLLWAAVALTVFFVIGPSRVRAAISNATKIGFAGFEFEFKSEIEAAAKERQIVIPHQVRDQLARRMERLRNLTAGIRILWIDDQPQGNRIEIGLLNHLGAMVDLSETDFEARGRLRSSVYDIVLSDMARAGDDLAGKKFLPEVTAAMLSPPVIFYVGEPRDVPVGAFGLTTRPDELFHLILDALERRGD